MTKRFGEKSAEVVAAEKALKINDNRKASGKSCQE